MDVELHCGAHQDGESERVEVLRGGELSAQRVRLSDSHREEYFRVLGQAS